MNRNTDGGKLCRLEQKAADTLLEHPDKEAAKAWLLGQLVVRRLGGGIGKDIKIYEGLVQRSSSRLRTELKSIVVPLGGLEHGLARHRALLFKVNSKLKSPDRAKLSETAPVLKLSVLVRLHAGFSRCRGSIMSSNSSRAVCWQRLHNHCCCIVIQC